MIYRLITGVAPVCDFWEVNRPGDGDGQGYGVGAGQGFGDGYHRYSQDDITFGCDLPVALIPEDRW